MAGVLDGLRVLDLTAGDAGALCSLVLADYGAEVVKVERPGGDAMRRRAGFPLWYRGKKSVVVDLGRADGRAAVRRLAEGSDVLLQSFRPGVAERLRLGYEDFEAQNPALVYTVITGFGSRGPSARLKAYEGIVLARMGGMDHVRGMAARPGPAFPAAAWASFSAAHAALQGTLAALYVRERTGRGQQVETSLVQALCAHDPWEWFLRLLCERYPDAYTPAPPVSAGGVPLSPFIFRLLVAQTRDGQWLQFSQTSPHLFREFIAVLGLEAIWDDPVLRTAPEFEREADALRFWDILLTAVASRTVAEWDEVFQAHPNVWAERFRTAREAMDHPQMRHNGDVIALEDPRYGRTLQLAPFVHMSETPAVVRMPAPALGEHTDAVLSELRTGGRAGPTARAAAAPPRRPLDGVTILELGLWYAAPYGTALLADLGARVVKIEPLTGEPMRHIMPVPESGAVKVLQGKESVALDLERPEAREIVRRLVCRADLALVSYRAGVAERLGVDAASLRRENPRLVYLSAPGYGVDGPCARKPAFAPTIGAAVGAAVLQAGPSVPRGTPLGLDDVKAAAVRLNWAAQAPANADGCSALGVATALLLGLVARERTGRGQAMRTSMLCTTAYALVDGFVDYPGKPPQPEPDPMLLGMSALYRLYEAADGWIFLACPQPREWDALCRALVGDLALAADPRFGTPEDRQWHDGALAATLAAIFHGRAAEHWEQHLAAHDIGCAVVTAGPIARCAMDDPIMRENDFLAEVEHPLFGRHRRLAPLARLSHTPGEARPACALGAHTAGVLAELGYDADAIRDLTARRVVAVAGV